MFGTLLGIALRNLWAHKIKTVIVGGILTFGTLLVLIGASLLSSLDASMAESLVGSIAGHLQISSAKGKDKLVLFPSPIDGTEIGELKDFPTLRRELEAMEEVKAVVPMGFDFAMIFGGNLIDVKLEALHKARKSGDQAQYAATRDHVRRIVEMLSVDLKNVEAITNMETAEKSLVEGILNVRKAAQADFWVDFDAHFDERMVFLENKVARMAIGEDFLPLRYMGTDPERFKGAFSRFEIVDGEPIPAGKRGILMAKFYYEEFVKHKTARRLDKIKDKLAEGLSFDDAQTANFRRQNINQYKEITYQLDGPTSDRVRKVLKEHLGSKEDDLVELVKSFMDMSRENFETRYKLFYDEIAPHLLLYRVRVGDTLTLRGYSSSGYATSVNVKVYGTFRFRSLEKSVLAGAVNVIDIMSFRDLYGLMTADRLDELATMQQDSGATAITRDDAEDALFGEEAADAPTGQGEGADAAADDAAPATATDAAVAVTATGFDEFAGVDMAAGAKAYRTKLFQRVYTQQEIDGGVVRNAAVVLHHKSDIAKVTARILALSDQKGYDLRVQNWREASGMIGDFMGVIYIVLAVAILGVFGVALFIINNSTVMATIERTREIGTMRAIGAQRNVVLTMFVLESLLLGAIFGLFGTALGVGVVTWMNAVGIPAVNDTLVFLFAGPRLHPTLEPLHIVAALALVMLVTVMSSLHPAWLATRVTPLEAMQEDA